MTIVERKTIDQYLELIRKLAEKEETVHIVLVFQGYPFAFESGNGEVLIAGNAPKYVSNIRLNK